ncbi:hypothetical protein THOM_1640 [Trachipleistophora hominis]|uniref:Uncharacterized protein n=1 Tax=Trachipleistophora hominis TaxID=72359 RepID=L7JWL2_TRAHO|nr:hypothetical protein THOM_1640 [Trachipleistophora hominis]
MCHRSCTLRMTKKNNLEEIELKDLDYLKISDIKNDNSEISKELRAFYGKLFGYKFN